MRVAIATEGNEVAPHFGRCASYTLAEIEEGRVLSLTGLPNPGHQPGFLPGYLAEQGVECIIAGGMGPRAVELFEERGIDTVVGVWGLVTEIAEQYARGELVGGRSTCVHDADPSHRWCGKADAEG